jgi:hypothetical protein
MSTHAENVKAYRALQATRRDSLIAAAVTARKIAPDRAEDVKRMYDNDPKSIEHLLTAPVAEGGLMAGNAAAYNPLPPPVVAEYPADWLPEVGTGGRQGGNVMLDGVAVDVTAQAPPPAANTAQYPAEWLAAAPRLGQGSAVPGVPSRITLEPGL